MGIMSPDSDDITTKVIFLMNGVVDGREGFFNVLLGE